MDLSNAYALLYQRFGTHGAAAQYLGMTQQHYAALRNGRANVPARTAEYIILKAQELSGVDMPPPPVQDTPTPEAHP